MAAAMMLVVAVAAALCAVWLYAATKMRPRRRFRPIPDQYQSLAEVQTALHKAGMESSNLIVGVDFTKSNLFTGKDSFGGKSLHHINVSKGAPPPGAVEFKGDGRGDGRRESSREAGAVERNPYQRVIDLIGRALGKYDDDSLIPAFGFGDARTADHSVFSLNPSRGDGVCRGMGEVLRMYTAAAQSARLSGPTSFRPLVDAAIDVCRRTGQYHILIIIADGQVVNKSETVDAIVRASCWPLSIVMVGVGDGPWDDMERFDDEIPERRFDNFQFVNFDRVVRRSENPEVAFAVAALQEIPDQYAAIRRLKLLARVRRAHRAGAR